MVLTSLLALVALAQFFYFGMEVGRARGRFGVQAPAISGHPEFERYFRVHMNTLEMLVLLLPAAFVFARFGSDLIAAIAIGIYIVGRFVYFRAYVADPAKRSIGFMLSALPALALLIGGIVQIARELIGV